jgi:hypothetical protein
MAVNSLSNVFFSIYWLGEIRNEFFGYRISGNGKIAACARWWKRIKSSEVIKD